MLFSFVFTVVSVYNYDSVIVCIHSFCMYIYCIHVYSSSEEELITEDQAINQSSTSFATMINV